MKGFARIRLASLAVALAMPLLSSCKEDTIVGSYTATTFTYAQAGGTTKDVLAAGGNLDLTIYHDFSTTGSILIPATITGAAAASGSLLGAAAQDGQTVTITTVADGFMNGMTFTFDGTSLTGTRTVSGITLVVTLSK